MGRIYRALSRCSLYFISGPHAPHSRLAGGWRLFSSQSQTQFCLFQQWGPLGGGGQGKDPEDHPNHRGRKWAKVRLGVESSA